MYLKTVLGVAALSLAVHAHAGPFSTSDAVSKDSSTITHWATGYQNYVPGPGVSADYQTPAKALGAATGNVMDVVSLGEGGSITLTFSGAIFNGAGADFAVFENGFDASFLELAWVEVSSDGVNFTRFKGYSFTPAAVGTYGTLDASNIQGLAGKYMAGLGTPFDLDALAGTPGLDINHVRYVRIVDIIGNGSVFDNYPAVLGGPHPIYDPYPNLPGSPGFDLEAIGVMHWAAEVPEPASWHSMLAGLAALAAILRLRKHSGRRVAPAFGVTAMLAFAGTGPAHGAVVSGFEEQALAPNSHYFPRVTGSFTSGAASFNHDYFSYVDQQVVVAEWWNGWVYSNQTDTVTAGLANQFSAYSGSGANGSSQYGVAYVGPASVSFAVPTEVAGAWFTNTTYTALSMLYGDSFAKKFGGVSGNDPDFLKLVITGVDTSGKTLGSVDFYLADYRYADNSADYIVRNWTFVDLSSLGRVSGLQFTMVSSDNSVYAGVSSMNTPSYFAMDDLTLASVPEPATLWTLGIGLLALASRRKVA